MLFERCIIYQFAQKGNAEQSHFLMPAQSNWSRSRWRLRTKANTAQWGTAGTARSFIQHVAGGHEFNYPENHTALPVPKLMSCDTDGGAGGQGQQR